MSDRLRVIRDQISVGDDVLVVGHGHGPPRPARVREVMRGAVKVIYSDTTDKQPRAVALKNLQRVEFVESPTSSKHIDQPVPAPVVAVVSVPTPVVPADDLQTWLEMGRDLIGKIEADLEAMRTTEADIRSDARALLGEADRCAVRATELSKRLETLRSIAGN